MSFLVHFAEVDRAGCFTLILLLLPGGCWCSMSLPLGAVGSSAVYECLFMSTSFFLS